MICLAVDPGGSVHAADRAPEQGLPVRRKSHTSRSPCQDATTSRVAPNGPDLRSGLAVPYPQEALAPAGDHPVPIRRVRDTGHSARMSPPARSVHHRKLAALTVRATTAIRFRRWLAPQGCASQASPGNSQTPRTHRREPTHDATLNAPLLHRSRTLLPTSARGIPIPVLQEEAGDRGHPRITTWTVGFPKGARRAHGPTASSPPAP